MELTLKRLLEQAEFTDAKRGYDREQVDEFLDKAVAMATKVEARLTQVIEQARQPAAEGGPTPAEIDAEVERRVRARLAEMPAAPAVGAAGPSEDETVEEARRTLLMAQRTADAAVREAREDAAKLLSDAQERATRLNAEAEATAAAAHDGLTSEIEAERRAAHARLAGEIAELEGAREALRTDVTVLERHVEEQRSQLGSTIGELQRLLDDPAGFRLAPAPALIDPEIPAFAPGVGPVEQAPSEPEAAAPEPAAEPQPADPQPAEPQPADGTAQAQHDDAAAPDGPPAMPELTFDEVDHAAPGTSSLPDAGPPTAPVSAVELGFHDVPSYVDEPPRAAPGEEDAFLAELRKAMGDEEPLGPRDHLPAADPYSAFGNEEDGPRGWRFGKRR
ncbi:MAG: hypothetical protein JWM47_471 [Acidimicrobiales bacterium]|nr:hypothetical protein [Acidimicrobiales bacterium]